jgi:hypothetical protein
VVNNCLISNKITCQHRPHVIGMYLVQHGSKSNKQCESGTTSSDLVAIQRCALDMTKAAVQCHSPHPPPTDLHVPIGGRSHGIRVSLVI